MRQLISYAKAQVNVQSFRLYVAYDEFNLGLAAYTLHIQRQAKESLWVVFRHRFWSL